MSQGKPVIGLIGGIGAGKSFVARLFAAEGCGVIDADALARLALQDEAVKAQLREWWGPTVIDAQGRVDRAAVSRRVFEDMKELARIESVVHPFVHDQRRLRRAQFEADPAVRAIVDDTPLLLEKSLEQTCDVLVFVDAPRELREQRVREARGWDAAELGRRERSQWPLDKKRRRADYVVENHRDEQACAAEVRRVLEQILARRRR